MLIVSRQLRGILIVTAVGFGLGLLARLAFAPSATQEISADHLDPKNSHSRLSGRPSLASLPAAASSGELSELATWLDNAERNEIVVLLDNWDALDPSPHYSARLWCLLRLAELDPALALKLGAEHTKRYPTYNGFLDPDWILPSILASSDPTRFADESFLDTLGLDPEQKARLLGRAQGALASDDPHATFLKAKAEGLPLKIQARALAQKNPAGLAAELSALGPNHSGFCDMAQALLHQWSKTDLAAARKWLATIEDPELARGLSDVLVASAARANPDREEAAASLAQLPNGRNRVKSLVDLLSTWARDDLDTALTWATGNLSSHERTLAITQMCEHLMEADPLRALRILQPLESEIAALPHSWPLNGQSVILPEGGQARLGRWSYNTSPGNVLQNARRNYADRQPREYLEFEVNAQTATSNPRMPQTARRAIKNLVGEEGATGLGWIQQNPDHPWRDQMLFEATREFGSNDLPAAQQWLNSLDDPLSEPQAVFGIATVLDRQQNFAEAWALAAPLATNEDAFGTLSSIATNWIRQNREQAAPVLEATEMSAPLRRTVESVLKK